MLQQEETLTLMLDQMKVLITPEGALAYTDGARRKNARLIWNKELSRG